MAGQTQLRLQQNHLTRAPRQRCPFKMTKTLLSLWILLLSALLAPAARAQNAPEIRGIWIHTYRPQNWDEVMGKIKRAGLNSVFVRVARGVNALYPSKILPMDGWAADAWKNGAGTDELKAAIDAAHRNGLEFHAWKVNFNASAGMRAGAGPAALYQQMKADDRLARDVNGVQTAALNPGDPRNRQLEFDSMMEILDNYDIDGLHFDYIRYTEIGGDGKENFDFDYGDISRREFEKSRGITVKNWPADVFAGALKTDYEDWERGNINDLVERVYNATKARRPRVQVSAAVWRANRKYRAGIKQDWTLWARKGWLDFVVPMDYSADATRFSSDMDEQISNIAGQIPFAAGIGTYLQKSPADVVHQIEIARAKGADGTVLFAYNDDNIDAILDLLAEEVNLAPAVPSYRAPRANWKIEGGIARRDAPLAFAAGSQVEASVAFVPASKEWESAHASVGLEGLQGQFPLDLGAAINLSDTAPLNGTVAVPAGIWQPILRGTATDAQGVIWPIAVRGPLVEGLDARAMHDLQARDLPPHFAAGKRRVAIYAGGQASAGLLKNLKDAPGVDAQLIYRLRPEMWREVDVLIVPHLEDVTDWTPQVLSDLRAYVQGGGRLILTHDAVGYRWHPRLFPEIGVGAARLDGTEVVALANDLGVTPGAVTQGYGDHVVIEAAPGATVLATEKDSGNAVVVVGHFGRGTVVMDGALLGAPSDGKMPASERRLLWELVGASAVKVEADKGARTEQRADQ